MIGAPLPSTVENGVNVCAGMARSTQAAFAFDIVGGTNWECSITMREAINQALYTYWNEIRGDRLAPKRFEIEPSRIAGMLPDTFILERNDTETSRFRLAGTRMCDVFGAEFRGRNFFDLFGAEDRITLQRQFSVIARQGAVGVFTVESKSTVGVVRFEILLLPLVHMRDTVDRYLGALSPMDRPAWLGHEPLTSTRIIANELIWPDGRPHAMIDNIHRQTPFLPHIREARIVKSDRRQFRVYDGGLAKADDE